MHPILFLAYDGCLHPDGVHHVNGEPEIRVQGHVLFEYAELLARLLEPYPELRIVLTTSWARVYGLEGAQAFLPAALQNRVVGTTYEFAGDMADWAELSEFDKVMRYVEACGVRTWLALHCEKYGWPEAFKRFGVWLYKGHGLGDDRAIKELTEKLEGMSGNMYPFGARHVGEESDTVRRRWDMALTKVADARIKALSTSTRFQAAFDALCSCGSMYFNVPLHAVPSQLSRMLEQLPTGQRMADEAEKRAVGLLQAWQSDDYWEPKHVESQDIDVVLNFVEAFLSAMRSRLLAT
ncbi:HAD domain-containing protein [Cupriavidus sp. BIC8F]|uniref:HAD domain-containing protein n=1 Tax=Cupriavidus sp. BIC8F TaxID=3079014 RepID=UPI002915D2F7|nr:HAD domain-containing protein [Cupriavidus sp. BIC8F]